MKCIKNCKWLFIHACVLMQRSKLYFYHPGNYMLIAHNYRTPSYIKHREQVSHLSDEWYKLAYNALLMMITIHVHVLRLFLLGNLLITTSRDNHLVTVFYSVSLTTNARKFIYGDF